MTAADSDFHALWMQNLDYPARLDRVFADNIWTAGVLGGTSFEVSPSSPAALTVDVAAGVCVVEGGDQTAQGKYLVRKQTGETGIAIAAAPGSGQRNDLIVVEVRDPNATGPTGDDARILVVQGTASASPVDPAVPDTCLLLARVRVPSGTGSIDSSLIDDLRVSADSQHDVLGVPAGTVVDTLRDTAPEGWALMQGQTLVNAQTVFPKLWDALPAAFKSGSDIILPDMRGRVTVGAGAGSGLTNRVLGASGGAETHTLTIAQMPSHTHTINHGHTATQASHSHTVNNHSHSINHGHSASSGTTGSSHSHSNTFSVNAAGLHSHIYADIFRGIVTQRVFSGTGGVATIGTTGATSSATTDFNIPAAGSHTHSLSGSVGTGGSTHTHNITVNSHSGSSGGSSPGTNSQTPAVTVASHSGSSGGTGGGAAHNIMQPFYVTNKMIRVR